MIMNSLDRNCYEYQYCQSKADPDHYWMYNNSIIYGMCKGCATNRWSDYCEQRKISKCAVFQILKSIEDNKMKLKEIIDADNEWKNKKKAE